MDLVGPLPTTPGILRYAVVVVEYFTKWIEAKPLAIITSHTVKRFFWQQIICHFRVPRELTVDNGTQFDSEVFKEFCMQIGTKLCFASIRHPQSNGLVERANNIILQGISRRLHGRPKGKWAEELTSVICSHNTSESRATKFTPFKLLFGEEAILPEEPTHKSPRVTITKDGTSTLDEEQLTKDLAEELRC